MGTSVSPSQGLVQTILTIRGLQQQDAAAQLAREQFGLTQAATQEQMLGHLGTLASSLPDPKVLLPHVQELSQRTGLSPDVLTTIFSNAAPSASATTDAAVAAGVKNAGDSIDLPAAFAHLVGQQPGALEQDSLSKVMFQGAHQYLSNLPDDQRQLFNAGVATRLGQGQTLGQALQDQIFAALPKDQQQQAILIGKGLAPSAGEVIQGRLGAAKQALDENAAASNSAYQQMQIEVAKAEAQSKLNGPQLDKALTLIKNIGDFQQYLAKNSGTFTPLGQQQNNASLNAMYEELKSIDPQIGAMFEPVPTDKPLSATSPMGAFLQKMRQQP